MRVLVTGATGFVGTAVCRVLLSCGHEVRAAVRRADASVPAPMALSVVGDIDRSTDWRAALEGVDAVVHLAGRAHLPGGANALADYARINVDGSETLARAARLSGVGAFVFVSSIKVNGEVSPLDCDGLPRRFSGEDTPQPRSPYGATKWQAEQGLSRIFNGSATKLVILRPPLIYGAGQKGNLASLMRAIDYGVPLPFAALANRRSLVGVENFADAITTVLAQSNATAGTFTLADVDLSSAELVHALAAALDKRARLFRLPLGLLHRAARLLGREAAVEKLSGSLLVDCTRFKRAYDWEPKVAMSESLRAAALSYRAGRSPR